MGASLDRDHVFQSGKGPAGPGLAPPPAMPAVPIRHPVGGMLGQCYQKRRTRVWRRVPLPSGAKEALLSPEVHGGRGTWAGGYWGHRTSTAQTQQGPATPGWRVLPKGKGHTFTPKSSQTLLHPLWRMRGGAVLWEPPALLPAPGHQPSCCWRLQAGLWPESVSPVGIGITLVAHTA